MKNHYVMAAILLIAAALRLFRLADMGLAHDEVANWLIDTTIQAGHHHIYFTDAYGHEAGFHYLQTLFITLIGDHTVALRLPAALLGIILVAVTYRLINTLYNNQIAIVTSLLIAITFFPIFYSRLALRAIMLPVISGSSAYFFWQAWHHKSLPHRHMIYAGCLAGLSLYSYMASRVVPIFYIIYGGLYLLVQWKEARSRIYDYFLFILPLFLLSAPLVWYLLSHPNAEIRTTEIDAPLQLMLAGDFTYVWQNLITIVGVFGWSGDPLWRQNVAFSPIFNPFTALLFYSGILIALWRHNKADMFALLWLATAVIPSILTVDAPSTIRMINMLPFLTLFPALTIEQLTKRWRTITHIIIAVCMLWGIGRTFIYTHYIWPNGGDVPFVWQTSLTDIARHLDRAADPLPTTIVGWTPDTMDVPTIELALKNDDLDRRFSGTDTLVLPISDGMIQLVRPTTPDLPFAPAITQWLAQHTTITKHAHFMKYEVGNVEGNPNEPLSIFGGQLALLSHTTCATTVCDLLTIWQVISPITTDLQLFVHVLDAAGNIISQSDGMSANEQFLQLGDIILHAHTVDLTGSTAVHAGVYLPIPPYPRLKTADSADYVHILLTDQ